MKYLTVVLCLAIGLVGFAEAASAQRKIGQRKIGMNLGVIKSVTPSKIGQWQIEIDYRTGCFINDDALTEARADNALTDEVETTAFYCRDKNGKTQTYAVSEQTFTVELLFYQNKLNPDVSELKRTPVNISKFNSLMKSKNRTDWYYNTAKPAEVLYKFDFLNGKINAAAQFDTP